MVKYKLHYNASCKDCARLAELTCRLDWLGRFEVETGPSPIGVPTVGEIHVVDNRKAKVFSGAHASKIVCENIPAYWPIALFLKLPFIFRRMAIQKPGCNGDRCVIK